jgi:hypothetical protein
MKTKIFVLTSLLALSAGSAAWAGEGYERVDSSQLPPRVRRSFETASHGERIREVRVQTIQGRLIYEIDTGRPGGRIMRIAADGEILNPVVVAPGPNGPPHRDGDGYNGRVVVPAPVTVVPAPPIAPAPVTIIRVEELPSHARQRIERDYHGHRISRITRENYEGRVVFGLQFGDGEASVFIGEDGAIVRRR